MTIQTVKPRYSYGIGDLMQMRESSSEFFIADGPGESTYMWYHLSRGDFFLVISNPYLHDIKSMGRVVDIFSLCQQKKMTALISAFHWGNVIKEV